MRSESKPRAKSDETRQRILSAATELFRREGFESTTMRDIAAASDMAAGAAYYYFESKEAIVLAFYSQAQEEMRPRLEAALQESTELRTRILSLLNVKFEYFAPNRRLLGTLSAFADPEHPLSPFGESTRAIREGDMEFFSRAMDDSGVRIPADLRQHLPRLLWMYQMGLILFWIYDRSEGQSRTRTLVEKSLDLLIRLLRLSGLPTMKPLRKMVLDLVHTVAGD